MPRPGPASAGGLAAAHDAELLSIVGLAAKTNHLVTALQVPVDAVFDQDAAPRS